MTLGDRLREERERLGMTQPALGQAAGATKQTVFAWETGKSAPGGFQLSALADIGVDVLYVITGQHAGGVKPGPTLTDEETALLALFRAAAPAVRGAAMGALVGAPTGGMRQTQHGSGTQLGQVTGDVNIGGKKRKG